MTPVWLLDIDGVINACTRKPDRNVWPADQWVSGHAEADLRRFPILAARPVADFIRQVHEEKRAEIRWHTTWQHTAANVGELLGLPDFPVQDAPEFREQYVDWWKLPAALRVVEEERRPLVWTDDDADPWNLTRAERDRLVGAGPVLIVAPPTHTGLTPKHLRQIGAFLDAHGGAS